MPRTTTTRPTSQIGKGTLVPRGLADKTMALIDAIQPATVRGVCYQLFNRKLIPDMSKNATGRVSRMLTTARERGLISWEWIVDETREIERAPSWDDPVSFMEQVKRAYRKDRWADQPERVIVVSEKGTVGGVLRPVIDEWGVPFGIYHGFGSATALNDLAQLSVADRRPLTILYIGDHDPSGRYMSEADLPERLRRYGGRARIERITVTTPQIASYGLLTFSASEKRKDVRHPWFVAQFGETCCELDALDPNIARGLVDAAIRRHVDLGKWQRANEVEAAELHSLNEFFAAWPGAA